MIVEILLPPRPYAVLRKEIPRSLLESFHQFSHVRRIFLTTQQQVAVVRQEDIRENVALLFGTFLQQDLDTFTDKSRIGEYWYSVLCASGESNFYPA